MYTEILQFRNIHNIITRTAVQHNSPAMLSPRGQSGLGLGLGVETLASTSASASKLWPRPRGFGLSLASISLSYYVIGYFSCKNRVKFGNFFLIFPAIILNHMLLIIIWYFFHNYFWPRPRPRPRLTSLQFSLYLLPARIATDLLLLNLMSNSSANLLHTFNISCIE